MSTFRVGLVWRDGNPEYEYKNLTAESAQFYYMLLCNKYARSVAPVVLCYKEDDPEAGYWDFDRLQEEIDGQTPDGPDLTAADLYDDFDCGLGEMDCGGE